nr:biofilm-associated protein [Nitrosopumilaceae archaeon]NIU87044.1 biofilm-associated protein [Nitrosopumilaceae archaeon]NIV64780.1 biofilm-associated protein [Nitrosopumilaceae archaeon]NIX61263.1 biofilm-associated protein [Nitrosopumilaceae archaeon]
MRLGEGVGAITDAEEIKLTTKGIPDSIYRGEKIEMTGTAAPGTTVTINIKDPDDKVTTTNATEADQRGNWSFS